METRDVDKGHNLLLIKPDLPEDRGGLGF